MLTCEALSALFARHGFTYFTGVADSTYKPWMSFLAARDGRGLTHRIAPIERDAIGLAAAYHVATGEIGVAYMQNSGLGNTVNPLVSLAHGSVYRVPMLLMVGWRGRPGKADEPQHAKMGAITPALLDLLDVEHAVLPADEAGAAEVLARARARLDADGGLFALIVPDSTLAPFSGPPPPGTERALSREQVVEAVAARGPAGALLVATTGKAGRELFEARERAGEGAENDFLMIGAMGLASSFALELALQRPAETVVVLDGDGAALMSAGALSTVGLYAPRNLRHVLIDNGVHESTGGQPTTASAVDFPALALACGYRSASLVETPEALEAMCGALASAEGPAMWVVKVRPGSRSDLGRPSLAPEAMKARLMRRLGTAP